MPQNRVTDLLLCRSWRNDACVEVLVNFPEYPWIAAACPAHHDSVTAALLDINMGCPVPKVVNNHEGSALMLEPKLVGEPVSRYW